MDTAGRSRPMLRLCARCAADPGLTLREIVEATLLGYLSVRRK